MRIFSRSAPPAWRRDQCKRPARLFSASDIRIIGTAASVGAWMGGGGIVGSLAASLGVPFAAKVMGLTR